MVENGEDLMQSSSLIVWEVFIPCIIHHYGHLYPSVSKLMFTCYLREKKTQLLNPTTFISSLFIPYHRENAIVYSATVEKSTSFISPSVFMVNLDLTLWITWF